MSDSDTQNDLDFERVRRAVEDLSEHFDTVQIFVTRHAPEQGGTFRASYGSGNWFARYGQVGSWLLVEESEMVDGQRDD